jgi:hypothetical protein
VFACVWSADSAVHISNLCRRLLKDDGANRVIICASHGCFNDEAMRLIDLSPISQVIISDSIALPANLSHKVVQLSIAPLLARVIQSDLAYILPALSSMQTLKKISLFLSRRDSIVYVIIEVCKKLCLFSI